MLFTGLVEEKPAEEMREGGQGAGRERRVSKGFKVKSPIKGCPLDSVLRLLMTLANAVSVA